MIWIVLAEAATLPSMHLICEGQSAANIPSETTTATVTDNQGYSVNGAAVTSRPTVVPMAIQFRIADGKAEMNLPRIAAPQLSSSKGGWYQVKNLIVQNERITGKVRFNFLASSSFAIDRVTGIMTSEGGFQGNCTKVEQTMRKF